MNHLSQPAMLHLSWVEGQFDAETIAAVISGFASAGDLGVLELQSGAKTAHLYFDHGQLIAATCDPFHAEDALVEVLSLRAGRYRFQGGPFKTPQARSRVDRPVQSALMAAVIERERLDDNASDGETQFDLSGLEFAGLDVMRSPTPDDHIETIFWKLMMRVEGQRTVREIVADFGFDLEELSSRLRPFVESGLLRFGQHEHGAVGAFLNALERRMFELFGPIGLVMIESAAKSANMHLETFQLDQAALFLTVLELEIPLERRRAFSWVARGLLERFNQAPLVPDEEK